MNLQELESNLRLEMAEEAVRRQREDEAAIAEEDRMLREVIRPQVLKHFTDQGIDGDDFNEHLTTTLAGNRVECLLELEGHTPISWEMEVSEGEVKPRHWNSFHYLDMWDSPQGVKSLAECLVLSANQWVANAKKQADYLRQEAEREAREEKAKEEARNRGTRYLGLMDEYPILRPILDVLVVYLEDRELFEAQVMSAENYADATERIMSEKLENARAEADNLQAEADRLRYELYDERDAHDETKRRQERGW